MGHVGRWGPGLGDTPVRLELDPDHLLADPAANRGKLFQLVGTLEQPGWLPPPDDAIAEWFVRDARLLPGGGGLGHLWVVVVPVAVMLVVFLALLVYARRGGRPARAVARLVPPVPGGEPPLPDDPVEALGELRRRAGARDS